MTALSYSDVVETARQYYNSEDADNFYFHVWGGEDIHIGIYQHDDEPIATASRRTVAQMTAMLTELRPGQHVLDIGAGYGGSARFLARQFDCRVTALNLSETENARNRERVASEGLGELVDVVDGNFETIPAADKTFDVVWSQDAILHSGERQKVVAEAARVLKPGGTFIFTDPMQADDCPAGVLGPVLDRIHLQSLGSVSFYREAARTNGLDELQISLMTHQLVRHYSRVREELIAMAPQLRGQVSEAYRERMLQGLSHWIEAGDKGYLAWGILMFRKPSANAS